MMLNEKISTLIPKMAIPTIIAQLVTTIYNLVDTFFVSTLGTNATAAIGVNSSLDRVITLFGSLLGAGACSYIARLLGAKKKDAANRVLSTFIFIGLGFGVVVLLVGQIFANPLLMLLGATEECLDLAVTYARYILLAAPFMVGQIILNMCLRSEGRSTYSGIGIATGCILNCFLDPLFIFGMNLGIGGASIATAISKCVSFIILLVPYLRKNTSVTLSIRNFKLNAKDTWEVLSIGSTSFFRSLLQIISSVLLNHLAGAISTSALAAFSVSNRIMQFPFGIILGFGQGYQPVVGYNWSAKKADRVHECFRFGVIVSIIVPIIMGVIIIVFAQPLIRVFNSAASEEVMTIGVMCITFESMTLPIHGLVSIVNMFYAGIGYPRQAMALSTSRQGYCYIPTVIVMSILFGINGIAVSQALADVFSLIPGIPLAVGAFRLIKKMENNEVSVDV